MLLFPLWGMTQVDKVAVRNNTEIKGKIVEEVPGLYIRIQDVDYQLHKIPEEDIYLVERPQGIKGYWEAVHLREGGIIRGFIIEYQWLRSIKLEGSRRNIFEYEWAEIDKIVKEPLPDDENLNNRSSYLMKKSRKKGKQEGREAYPGYGLFFVEGGGVVADDGRGNLYPGIFGQAILSIYVTETFTLGVGGGMDLIQRSGGLRDVGQYGFVDGRLYFPRESWTPYLAMAGGFDWYRRGGYVNPGIGARKKIFKKFWLNGNLSVKIQQVGEETFSEVFEPGFLEMIQLKLVID